LSALPSLLVVALLLSLPAGAAGTPELQGDPFRGRKVLSEKLCTQCHSVWSHGGVLAPEMSTAVAGKGWLDLVGDFWNHTPRMIDAMGGRGYAWPTIDQREMADLVSYLYYLRLFDEPGDMARGAIAYSQLRCVTCHTLGGEGGDMGGPIDKFSAYPSAVILGQAMWNAGPEMQQAQIGRWTAISVFSGSEMADIQAYIRLRGVRTDREEKLLPLPDPVKGGEVFKTKRCEVCHRHGGGEGPDLTESALNRTVSEISGMLWNHSYAMNDWMRSRGIRFPRFEGNEMADLIAYLYFLGFVGEEGDPEHGRAVFQRKGCASCHEGPGASAPDLSGNELAADPIALSTAMWNHAPEMHELMAERAVAWPKFELGDMKDLAAYLRKVALLPEGRVVALIGRESRKRQPPTTQPDRVGGIRR
jgi:cytochrome c2